MENAYVTMVLAGVVSSNLFFIFIAIIASKIINLRLSAASVIASLLMAWISFIFIIGYATTNIGVLTHSKWLVAFVFMIFTSVFVFWLFVFQPKSLRAMMLDEIQIKEIKELKKEKLQLSKKLKDKHSPDNTLEIRQKIKELRKSILQKKLEGYGVYRMVLKLRRTP